jgi:hypothetical protein
MVLAVFAGNKRAHIDEKRKGIRIGRAADGIP